MLIKIFYSSRGQAGPSAVSRAWECFDCVWPVENQCGKALWLFIPCQNIVFNIFAKFVLYMLCTGHMLISRALSFSFAVSPSHTHRHTRLFWATFQTPETLSTELLKSNRWIENNRDIVRDFDLVSIHWERNGDALCCAGPWRCSQLHRSHSKWAVIRSTACVTVCV